MKEFKFNIGDRVVTVVNGELLRGEIKSLYTDMFNPQAIVKFEDGTTGKCELRTLALEPKAEPRAESEYVDTDTVKTDNKIPDDKEITITYGEYRNIAVHTIVDMTKDNVGAAMAILAVTATIATKLFAPEAEE